MIFLLQDLISQTAVPSFCHGVPERRHTLESAAGQHRNRPTVLSLPALRLTFFFPYNHSRFIFFRELRFMSHKNVKPRKHNFGSSFLFTSPFNFRVLIPATFIERLWLCPKDVSKVLLFFHYSKTHFHLFLWWAVLSAHPARRCIALATASPKQIILATRAGFLLSLKSLKFIKNVSLAGSFSFLFWIFLETVRRTCYKLHQIYSHFQKHLSGVLPQQLTYLKPSLRDHITTGLQLSMKVPK